MSYRKISVSGTTYEYVIGRTNVKIKGVGVFATKDNLEWFDHSPVCSCGEEYNCFADEGPMGYAVTPRIVRHLIERNINVGQ